MKNLIYIFLTIFLTSTFSFGQESNIVDSVIYVTPEEEAFMIDKESTSLFKIRSFRRDALLDLNRLISFTFAFEQKLNKSFSLSPIVILDCFTQSGSLIDFLGLGVEFRYYYKLSRLIKEKKQANNLSSNYFASSFLTHFINIEEGLYNQSNNMEISYGVQKRFLNYGYFDFRINLGVFSYGFRNKTGPFRTFSSHQVYLTTETNVGIGLGRRYELTEYPFYHSPHTLLPFPRQQLL